MNKDSEQIKEDRKCSCDKSHCLRPTGLAAMQKKGKAASKKRSTLCHDDAVLTDISSYYSVQNTIDSPRNWLQWPSSKTQTHA